MYSVEQPLQRRSVLFCRALLCAQKAGSWSDLHAMAFESVRLLLNVFKHAGFRSGSCGIDSLFRKRAGFRRRPASYYRPGSRFSFPQNLFFPPRGSVVFLLSSREVQQWTIAAFLFQPSPGGETTNNKERRKK